MKNSFLLLSLLLSFSVSAKDMASTEDYDNAYKESADGSLVYVGSCSVHQDMSGTNFLVQKTLVEYFDTGYGDMTRKEFLKKTRSLEIELIEAAGERVGSELPESMDDFEAEKIESTKFRGLDLYRLSIGVGGGNGMYLIYNRTVSKNKVAHELMAKSLTVMLSTVIQKFGFLSKN